MARLVSAMTQLLPCSATHLLSPRLSPLGFRRHNLARVCSVPRTLIARRPQARYPFTDRGEPLRHDIVKDLTVALLLVVTDGRLRSPPTSMALRAETSVPERAYQKLRLPTSSFKDVRCGGRFHMRPRRISLRTIGPQPASRRSRSQVNPD